MATESTRQELIDAATRAFAANGVATASLVEITRQAGQRNRGAVHYHFGGRQGLLTAVLEQHADFLGQRERQLLEVARQRPDDDVASCIEAVVRPVTELSETGWRGRCYLVIADELVDVQPAALPDGVRSAIERTGGYDVWALIEERLPSMDDDLRVERSALLAQFILRSVAQRARLAEDGVGRSRPQLPTERFIANLVAMATAMVTAPPVP